MGYYDSEILLALEGGGILGATSLALLVAALWLALRGRAHPGETGALVAVLVASATCVALHLVRVAFPFALLAGVALGQGRHPRPSALRESGPT